MYSFPCPACSILLRARDTREKAIACPECETSLLLHESNGQIIAEIDRTIELPSKMELNTPVEFRTWFALIGLAVIVIIGFAVYRGGVEANPASPSEPEEIADESLIHDQAPPDADGPEDSIQEGQSSSVEQKLQKIYGIISEFQQTHQHFPAGHFDAENDNSSQHSWIAELVQHESDGRLTLSTKQAWNDPVNDPFVRRRLDMFQNKNVEKLIGADRYPATHFAGLTGVGDKSEVLPKTHPRAGVFSSVRKTNIADIIDGTSNTILVVGVFEHLGSWARPGAATLRSFREEPYINGPDGIGTGPPDSMQVLMADGSVRTLSQETSPVIMRRMAAMADGLPLDLDVAGDPLTMDPGSVAGTQSDLLPEGDGPPIEPLFAPEPPRFNIQESLRQKIRSYKTSSPQSLEILLREFQELAGVPVDWSGLSEEVLKQEFEMQLADAELTDLLEELTAKSNLRYSIKPNTLVILEMDAQE